MYSRPVNSTSRPPTSLFDFCTASTDRVDRDSVGEQFVGIDVHLILAHKSAHRRHLGHAGHRLQRIAQIPVLVAAHLLDAIPAGGIDQRVLIDPSHRGSILGQFDVDAFGQPRRD